MATVNILKLSPKDARDAMLAAGIRRAYIVWDNKQQRAVASHPLFEPVAAAWMHDTVNYQKHEGVFFEIGAVTNSLMGAFVKGTVRGQAQGGLRFMRYNTCEEFMRDGLRLALGMGRKSALAGLWWGGGKGVIPMIDPVQAKCKPFRVALMKEYGCFISSLQGCFYIAEDVGTTVPDMDACYSENRYITCISMHLGGRGNPSTHTGYGCVAGMEAALDYCGRGSVAGKSVAIMGCGNVANAMTEKLLQLGVGRIIAADMNAEAVAAFNKRWAGRPVHARVSGRGDYSILYENVDVIAPCAVGGIINPRTIPYIKAKIICGSANNQLEDDTRDDKLLRKRGIRFCVDYCINRMGIVFCANEQYGRLACDPSVESHFDHNAEFGVYQTTKRILKLADERGISEVEAANHIADELQMQPHPIWGHRGQQIIDDLVAHKWAESAPLSCKY